MTNKIWSQLLKLTIWYNPSSKNFKKLSSIIQSVYLLKNNKTPNPELEGYKAVLWFLKARDYYNPYKKYESFTKGKKELESIIKKYPNNIELHFLRLTIQDNLPSFLGYNDNISEDEKFIKEKVKEIKKDPDLVQRIAAYLAQKK